MEPIRKYRPQTIRVQGWDDVEARYVEFLTYGWDIEPMLNLVKYIQEKGLDKRLFACTSMDKLLLTIYNNPAEWNRETLHVRYDGPTKMWHFYYLPKPYELPERRRSYPKENGIEKFEEYIRALKW